MGDGIRNVHALIINGDRAEHHVRNVDRAVSAIRADYASGAATTYLPLRQCHITTATQNAPADVDARIGTTLQDITDGINAIAKRSDDDDHLVVYFTGHGDTGGNGACISTPDGCHSYKALAELINAIPAGSRSILSDTCFGGELLTPFQSPHTEIFSLGSPGETVFCQEASERLWSTTPEVDANSDGVRTLRERIHHAIKGYPFSSHSQHATPEVSRSLSGSTHTKAHRATQAHTVQELGSLIINLTRQGKKVVVMYSADWCPPCKHFTPKFHARAGEHSDPNTVWILAKDVKGSAKGWNSFGVTGYPTVRTYEPEYTDQQVNTIREKEAVTYTSLLNSRMRDLGKIKLRSVSDMAKSRATAQSEQPHRIAVGSRLTSYFSGTPTPHLQDGNMITLGYTWQPINLLGLSIELGYGFSNTAQPDHTGTFIGASDSLTVRFGAKSIVGDLDIDPRMRMEFFVTLLNMDATWLTARHENYVRALPVGAGAQFMITANTNVSMSAVLHFEWVMGLDNTYSETPEQPLSRHGMQSGVHLEMNF